MPVYFDQPNTMTRDQPRVPWHPAHADPRHIDPGDLVDSRTRRWDARRGLRLDVAVFAALFVGAVLLQTAVGAYATERGNFSDESAHFMNGMLLRDYLTEGAGESPLQYARHYYLNYPKIAPGMWPPLYHGVLGLLLLPGWSPQVVALLLVAFATAWTAWRLYRILTLVRGRPVALALAALFLLTPVIINLSSAVMLDIIVAAFALEATYWLAIYVGTENWRHAAIFGIVAAGGCLTKGNGLAALLLPPIMVLFTRRFYLLRRSGLYIAAAIVLLVAAPLVGMSFYFDATLGDFSATTWADVVARGRFYSWYLSVQLGVPLLAVAGLGFINSLAAGNRRGDREAWAMVQGLSALLVAAVVFHLLNPHTVFTGRYLTLAVAPIFGLLPQGVGTIFGALRRPVWRAAARVALVAGMIFTGVMVAPIVAIRRPLGFRDAATFIGAQDGLAGHRMMVVSDENGEGAFVTEVATFHPEPAATVYRASKIMASDNWGGHNFRLRFESAAALMKELEDLHVEYVVVDESLAKGEHPLWSPTLELIHSQADRLERIYAASGARPVVLYRLKYQSPGPPKPPEMTISSPLGQWQR